MLKAFGPLPLRKYRDKYLGQSTVIVGSGPTLFDYKNLVDFDCPIFLINDTVSFEDYVKFPFFATHHRPFFTEKVRRSVFLYPTCYERPEVVHPYRESVNSFVNFIPFRIVTQCTMEDNRNNVSISSFPGWSLDKSEIASSEKLLGHTGSITTTIHFVWYCGFSSVGLIGCNPKFAPTHHHDERLSAMTGRKGSSFDLPAILENQRKFLEFFELEVTFIGDYEYWRYPTSFDDAVR